MAKATCSTPACERPVHSRGMCHVCYTRWYKANPTAVRRSYPTGTTRRQDSLINRLLRSLDRSGGADACWPHQRPQRNGYARITVEGVTGYAHRVAYELLVGPIPEGLHLDHLCRNRACCNPAHLEPVTCLVNIRRGDGNVVKTHCPQGHEYVGHNVIDYRGRRYCRTCRDARNAARSKAA